MHSRENCVQSSLLAMFSIDCRLHIFLAIQTYPLAKRCVGISEGIRGEHHKTER